MSVIACEIYEFSRADGPAQMARDDAMLVGIAPNHVRLRFYAWEPATLSLGYFQPTAERTSGLPFVRRTTGGGAIVHDLDLTYSLALPIEVFRETDRPWSCRMHDAIRSALTKNGVQGLGCAAVETGRGAFLCFEHQTIGDVLLGTAKVAGSAQRKRDRAVLIHGSVLLAKSHHASHLPGIRELAGVDIAAEDLAQSVLSEFLSASGWRPIQPRGPLDIASARDFSSDAWNFQR